MLTVAPTYEGKIPIPSPEVTQVMLEALDLHQGDKVLEIGTGSGYQTWRLRQTGSEVYSIELNPQWIPPSQLDHLVHLVVGDGSKGLPDHAPYRAIVSTCGVESVPKAWIDQLAPNGRLVAPVGDSGVQKLYLFTKDSFTLVPQRVLAYVKFLMMDESPAPKPVKPVYKERPDGTN